MLMLLGAFLRYGSIQSEYSGWKPIFNLYTRKYLTNSK